MNQSFFIAAVGAHQQLKRLTVHGNNIANLNTYGFKAEKSRFASLMYEDLKGIGEQAGLGGADADVPDAIDGGGGMNLYTFRNLVNFCLGFGWTAILLQDSVRSAGLRLFLAVLVGVGLVAAVMYLFKWLSGMQQSGTIHVRKSAVGCQGKVYLTIPGARTGEGKVQITISGAVREYAAITDSETLRTGTPIRVIEVINDSTLLVEELNSLII